MLIKATVLKEIHMPPGEFDGKKFPESFNIVLFDLSDPPEHRMEEMIHYRLKEDEMKHWGKLEGKTVEVGLHKTNHNRGGKATMSGKIIRVFTAKGEEVKTA